jgi:hypothetical protein
MQLFKLPPPPEDLVITPESNALVARASLLLAAGVIRSVGTAEENQQCAAVGSEMQKLVKGVEATRKDLTAPYLAAQRSIKSTSDAFCEPITTELTRLGRLAAGYRQEQERQAEAERRARAEEIARLEQQTRKAAEDAKKAAEKGDMMGELVADIGRQALADLTTAAITKPEPEAVKVAGQSFRGRELGWECLDAVALWKARPDLCTAPTPNGRAIRAVCCPEMPVPGLRLWWEAKCNFKSR